MLWPRQSNEGQYSMVEGEIYLNTGVSQEILDVFARVEEVVAATPYKLSELCTLMRAENSDKARAPEGKHNYSQLYHALFGGRRSTIGAILEVGIGTNNPDLPSSMGIHGTPGASLRAWRSYFPNAQIFGADIDRNILFEEERITTTFLDQLEPATIKKALETFGVSQYEVIIDDGLHRLAANANLYSVAYNSVKNGGIYIVEDINTLDANVRAFKKWISRLDKPAIFYRLPHWREVADNCVVVIEY